MHGHYGSAITVGINADDAITGSGSGDGIKMYGSTIPLPPRSLPKPRACCAAGVVSMINVAEVAAVLRGYGKRNTWPRLTPPASTAMENCANERVLEPKV